MSDSSATRFDLLRQGLRLGLGFGASVALVHVAVGIGLILLLGQPPLTAFVTWAFVMEFVLGGVAGGILCPLLKVSKRPFVFPASLTLLWIGMEYWVAVDPTKVLMWMAPSLVAFGLFSAGRHLWARHARRVAAAVPLTVAALLTLPILNYNATIQESLGVPLANAPEDAPDVLVIVMDTVRAQSTSLNGYARETTPVLEQLASEGVAFLDANAPSTWSLPAHASLFTGTFPSWNNAHGETRYLDDRLPTLAETMAGAGWETLCFSANPHISDAFGLTRGFMANDEAWRAGPGARGFTFIYRWIDAVGLGRAQDKGGSLVVSNIQNWMDRRPDEGPPAFVFVNFLEAHFPFHQLPNDFLYSYQNQPIGELRNAGQIAFGVQFGRQLTDEEFDQVHQPLVDMYDAGVRYTDHLVGEVVDQWRQSGRLDNTVVIVLGDHGEAMGEHRAFGHVSPVNEVDLRVPLVMRYPARIPAGSVVEPAVSTMGMFASILDMTGVDYPGTLQMDTLLPGIHGEVVGQPVMAERFEEEMLAGRFAPGTANGEGPLVNPRGRYRTFRSGPWKLVQHSEDGDFLYNLEEDPGELNELAKDDPEQLETLIRDLALFQSMLGLPDLDAPVDAPRVPPDLDAGTVEALRSLGYVE